MGLAKAEMMRREELEAVATRAALACNAIKCCPAHDHIVLDACNDEAAKQAYAIGTNMWKAGEIDGTREELMEAIKTVISTAGEECPICAKD